MSKWYVVEKEVHGSGTRDVWVSDTMSQNSAKTLRDAMTEDNEGDTWFVAVQALEEDQS